MKIIIIFHFKQYNIYIISTTTCCNEECFRKRLIVEHFRSLHNPLLA